MINQAYASDIAVLDQKGFLELGTIGAALLVLVITIIIVLGVVVHVNNRWAKTVDIVTDRHDQTSKENAKRYDDRAHESNLAMLEFATALKGLEGKVEANHPDKHRFYTRPEN